MMTADGKTFEVGMQVFVWDDLPEIPTLGSYVITRILSPHGTVHFQGPGRLIRACIEDCWADRSRAIIDGFGKLRQSLEERFGDVLCHPVKVGKSGVTLTIGGQRRRFGGKCPELADRIGESILVGCADVQRPESLVAYDIDGEFIAPIFPNAEGGASCP